MREFEFVRWGGLSPVKQERFVPDKVLNSKTDEDFGFFGTFHRPPTRKGIYAFVPECIEMFLVAWKMYKDADDGERELKKEFEHARRFKHSGKVWTHIFINHPSIIYYRRRDSWYETDTDSLPIILKKHKWELSKEITSEKQGYGKIGVSEFSAFIKAWRIYSKDHFEIFIERLH